jgi:hypothetical protein
VAAEFSVPSDATPAQLADLLAIVLETMATVKPGAVP